MKRIELLAPVGSKEAFISAINNGADAIYLAGEHFGAREKATFSNDELKEMIKYAHLNEVKVHVVVNTLIYDDEIDKVMEFIDFLYVNDVDAIIVQDLGIITLVHNTYPDLEIHASTQLNTLNLKEAQILKDLGVKRIVMGREASLETIKEIINKVQIDVEVFAHGALCMGYSGQCLLSSLTMKKSGNRGECLQLCRLPYSLMKNEKKVETEGEYLLSTKDLNTLNYLDKLIEAGVTSLKIEGRVKSANYVGKVVSLYRKYLDMYYQKGIIKVDSKDEKDLAKVFNRGFTKGYILNERNSEIANNYRPNNIGVKIGKVVGNFKNKVNIKLEDDLHQGDGIRIVNKRLDIGMFVNKLYVKGLLVNQAKKGEIISLDIQEKVELDDLVYKTSDFLLNKELEENNKKIFKRFPLKVKASAYIGKNLVIEASDDLNNQVEVKSEYLIDKANNNPTSKERIKEQINKLNESVYYLKEFNFVGDNMIIIPISVINKLRKQMIEELNNKREIINKRKGKVIPRFKEIKIVKDDFNYVYKVSDLKQYKIVSEIVNKDDIYFTNKECMYAYPRISNNLKVDNRVILINELSDLDTNKEVIANAYLNTTNIYALYTLYSLGVKRVTLSVELGLERIKNLMINYQKVFNEIPNLEVIVYGKIDLMITKHCLINKYLKEKNINCGGCFKDKYYLLDRKGYKLELVRDGLCNLRVVNPKALHLIEYCNYLKEMGISKLRIEFTNENEAEIKQIIEGYKKGSLSLNNVTRGYFSEVVEG